jgi:hypothetical protein
LGDRICVDDRHQFSLGHLRDCLQMPFTYGASANQPQFSFVLSHDYCYSETYECSDSFDT